VTLRDNRPVAHHRAAADPYRPAHRSAEDAVDLTEQWRGHGPPSWRLSGTLLALAVILLLVTCAWLAYQYTQMWLR
jgi:hypothetical protein